MNLWQLSHSAFRSALDSSPQTARRFRSPGIAWHCIGCRSADRWLGSGRCRTLCRICRSARVRPGAARSCTRGRQSLRGGELGDARQRPGLFQAAPAIHQDERRHDAQPDGSRQDRQQNQSGHANKTDDAGNQQTVRAAKKKPQQRAQNLSAIERINRHHVENEQTMLINQTLCKNAYASGCASYQPRCELINTKTETPEPTPHSPAARPQCSKLRAGALRRGHIRHAAQRPQHDVMGLPAHRTAGQLMAEFMRQHDEEQRKIFRHIPDQRRIFVRAKLDGINRHEKPGPVDIDTDAGQREKS